MTSILKDRILREDRERYYGREINMIEEKQEYKLKNGEKLVVYKIIAPDNTMREELAKAFEEYWEVSSWRQLNLEKLKGHFVKWCIDRYFIGEVNGIKIAIMSYTLPSQKGEIATFGFVYTKPEYRGRGISSIMMNYVMESFNMERNLLTVYLAAGNLIAKRIYSKHGFCNYNGIVMRYLLPHVKNFDKFYFSKVLKTRIRKVTWGDQPCFEALYNLPVNCFIRDYPSRTFEGIGFESQFLGMIENNKNKVTTLVLENEYKRVIGVSSLKPCNSVYENHLRVLDFFIHPNYLDKGEKLIHQSIKVATKQQRNIKKILACIASCDLQKINLVKRLGFKKIARLQGLFVRNSEEIDLIIYQMAK